MAAFFTLASCEQSGIQGPINKASADEFTAQLDSVAADEDLVIPINSLGGYAYYGQLIQHAIETHEGDVTLTCSSRIASTATVILTTTEGVTRNADSNCSMLVHYAALHTKDIFEAGYVKPGFEVIRAEDFKGPYDALMANRSLQEVLVTPKPRSFGETEPYMMDRGDVINYYKTLASRDSQIIADFARASSLTEADVKIVLDHGDVWLNAKEAGFTGLVDTVDGRALSVQDSTAGAQKFCGRFPEVSLCDSVPG